LKIVGEGPMGAAVKDAAAANPSIEWLGFRPSEEVYELIGNARFLVCPSLCYENFPRVLVEAYAKATPVIASDLGAMAELVDHDRTGLRFPAGDAVALAAKVEQLFLAEPNVLERMRLAARDEYERKYTAASNYPALMAIYQKTLSKAASV
jgi:glycosyltransferase involved in cell wall biosynthesis